MPAPPTVRGTVSEMRWYLALRKTLYQRIYVAERPIRQKAKDKRCYSEAASITYRHNASNRIFSSRSRQRFSLRLGACTFLAVPSIVSCKPKHRKYQKADVGADRAGVVRPCGAQEMRISVVRRRDDRDRLKRPAAKAVVEHEFEHAVLVQNAARYRRGWPLTGRSPVRTCGSSMVNSSCRSCSPG